MLSWPCRGCDSKDGEIKRLTHANTELLNRILALSGQPPLAPQTGTDADDDAPLTPPELVKTIAEMDVEAEGFLKALADKRDMTPGDFADA